MNYRLRARNAVEAGIPACTLLRMDHHDLVSLELAVAEALQACRRDARRQALQEAANEAAGFVPAGELRMRMLRNLLAL